MCIISAKLIYIYVMEKKYDFGSINGIIIGHIFLTLLIFIF